MKKNNRPRIYLSCIALAFLLAACASTERVHTLSNTCLQSIAAADALEFSFAQYCWNKTFYTDKVQLQMDEVDGMPIATIRLLDECSSATAIDSQANVLRTTLYAYFDGLKQLSANSLVQYSTEPVTRNFSTRSFPNWSVDEKTVEAATTISNLLFRAIASGYRNEKIKQYIGQSDESIGVLIQKLVDYYDLLGIQLTNNSGNVVAFYSRYRSEQSPYLQSMAQKNMVEQPKEMEARAKELSALKKLLLQVKESHHEVNLKANTMSFKDWQQFISTQSSELFASGKALQYLIQQNKAYDASNY